MPAKIHEPDNNVLTKSDLIRLHKRSSLLLDKLVTAEGIYASTNAGWRGPFHAWFGRDSAVTADLIMSAEQLNRSGELSKTAAQAITALASWQGAKNNPETGEEFGKLPHEIRPVSSGVFQIQHSADTNQLPWFIDPVDNCLKNWDSCDASPLWVITMIRAQNIGAAKLSKTSLSQIKLALHWCLDNIDKNNQLMGFTGADLQPGRLYSGLHNQGWKDSKDIYQHDDGSLAEHPIKDVLINAEAWAALKYGAELFQSSNNVFANELNKTADILKKTFNKNFCFKDQSSGLHYLAAAVDGSDHQIMNISADAAMCLWAFYGDECVIAKEQIKPIVQRTMQSDMFNPEAGIRNISLLTPVKGGTNYHGSARTYWPFVSALIVKGFDHFGYKTEAKAIAAAMLKAISQFDSCVELFVDGPDHTYKIWRHPSIDQRSSANQAWTAAGVYYCSQYLLRETVTE